MYKSIILASSLFGSVYLFSTTLKILNDNISEDKISYPILISNGIVLFGSGIFIICSFSKSYSLLSDK